MAPEPEPLAITLPGLRVDGMPGPRLLPRLDLEAGGKNPDSGFGKRVVHDDTGNSHRLSSPGFFQVDQVKGNRQGALVLRVVIKRVALRLLELWRGPLDLVSATPR